MFSVTKRQLRFGQPSLIGLMPGIIFAALVIGAGGYYSQMEIMAGTKVYQVLKMSNFFPNLFFSLKVAAISTICSLILGTSLALWLWKQPSSFPGQLYAIPLILPHIIAAFFVIVFFSQSGLIASFLYHLKIIKNMTDFPVLVFDNNGLGIILAYVYKETAFVALLVLASLRKIPTGLIQTSRMLGASAIKRLRTCIFPAVSSTLWVVSIIIFLYSFGAYDIPYLIGSSSRPMVSIEAYRLFFEGQIVQRPLANLLLAAIWGISLLFLMLFILIRTFFAGKWAGKGENRLWM